MNSALVYIAIRGQGLIVKGMSVEGDVAAMVFVWSGGGENG